MLLLLIGCDPTSSVLRDDDDTSLDTDAAPDSRPLHAFDEPFDTLDHALWTVATWQLGATRLKGSQARLKDGGLNLRHDADGEGWVGAELYTSRTFRGGLWEATVVGPEAPGTVCAFFFYASNELGLVNEIDVELLADGAWFSVYRNWKESDGYENGPAHVSAVWPWPEGFVAGERHAWSFDWREADIGFLADGVEVARLAMVPDAPLPLHLNHWTSTTWPEVRYPPPASVTCRVESVFGDGFTE